VILKIMKKMMYKLSKEELEYLWTKIEYSKKKKAIEIENELFDLLKGDKKTFTEKEFMKILNSLEYSFKNKLKNDTINNEFFLSIQEKLPSNWIGVKFSNIKQHKKKIEKNKKLENLTHYDDFLYL